jgi:hypothetical protein
MDWGACFSSCSECYVDSLGFLDFHSPFFKQVLDCSCSFCEPRAGSLPMATTITVSLAKVAVVVW